MNDSNTSVSELTKALEYFQAYNFPIDRVNGREVLVMDSRLSRLVEDVYVTGGEGYKVAEVALGHIEVLRVHSSLVECDIDSKIALHDPLLNSSSQVSSVGGALSSGANNPTFFRIHLPGDYAERATSSSSGGARFPAILETMFPAWEIRKRALKEATPPNSVLSPDPRWTSDGYSWSAEDQNRLEELEVWMQESDAEKQLLAGSSSSNVEDELEFLSDTDQEGLLSLEAYLRETDPTNQLLVSSASSDVADVFVASSRNTLAAEIRDGAVSIRAELADQIVPARAERAEPVVAASNLPGEAELLPISFGGSVSPVEPPPASLFGKFIAVTVLVASLAFVGYLFMAFLNVYTTQTFTTVGNTLADISHSTRTPKWLTSTCEAVADWCLAKSSFFSSQEVIFTTNLSKLFNGFLTVQCASAAWAFVVFAIAACGLIIYYLKIRDKKKYK